MNRRLSKRDQPLKDTGRYSELRYELSASDQSRHVRRFPLYSRAQLDAQLSTLSIFVLELELGRLYKCQQVYLPKSFVLSQATSTF